MGLPIIPLFGRIARFKVDLLVAFMLFTLILGSGFAFGDKAPMMEKILYMYLFLFLIGRVIFKKAHKRSFPINKAIFNFGVMFFVTAILMLFIPADAQALLAASSFDAQVAFAVSFGVMYAFIKAYIEEDVFRNRLSVVLGNRGQAIAFGLFHFFVLVGVFGFTPALLIPIVILTVLGYVWGIVQDKYGTFGSTGSHFAYNSAVTGLLPKMMGAVV